MKTTLKNVLLAAGLSALAVPVVAQNSGATAQKAAHKLTVQQRKQHQQKRIAHGLQSGKLTSGEAASLERKEVGLNAEEREMREDNRGRLTAANRAQLQHQQNRVSKAIYHKKHNATVARAHAKNAAGPRTQQQRAAELKTGQLTSSKAAHLETKEASLHHQIHSDREPDGAKRTSEDRAQVNPQQNKNTNQIRLKKHNARMF